MTLAELEQRLKVLERQVAELRRERRRMVPLRSVKETFGMIGDDAEFDEVIRLGREYRRDSNAEGR